MIKTKALEQITRIKQALTNFQQNVRQMSRKKLIFLLIMIMSLSAAGAMIPSHFMVALSPSVKYRIFYYKRNFQQSDLHNGTYVVFDMYTKLHKNCQPCQVVKKIGCTEGNNLHVDKNNFYYCNDEYMGTAKAFTKTGDVLYSFYYNGPVPQKKLFVIGDHEDSYDSKYMGFINKSDIKAVALPIL